MAAANRAAIVSSGVKTDCNTIRRKKISADYIWEDVKSHL
jgi:hypothetical protein